VSGCWRSLYLTKLAAASPFLCCLVSPGSKLAFLRAFRTNDDKVSVSDGGLESGDGRHTILALLQSANSRSIQTIYRLFSSCGTRRPAHVDKGRAPPENRSFSPRRGILSVTALLTTNLGEIPLLGRGKVRDLYAVGDGLLLVATDRISAFDHVLGTGIPDKGKILTQISLFWFDLLKDLVPNHLITAEVDEYPAALLPYAERLRGRSMLVKRAQMFPIECVARGYLAGSGWKEYRNSGTVCGIPLPTGLEDGTRLPEPVFTPATKSEGGAHDENISYEETEKIVGAAEAAQLRRLTLAIYKRAAAHAEGRGIILADTKFEFGTTAQGVILADEVLTPDSSRFWDGAAWKPGGAQASFDKQFVRDYLEEIHWNKQAPAPGLPSDVVERTRAKYLEAFRRLTGRDLAS
jgi:phosphoribosylaminoimidazole-succinocarboxamide synthase